MVLLHVELEHAMVPSSLEHINFVISAPYFLYHGHLGALLGACQALMPPGLQLESLQASSRTRRRGVYTFG